MNKFKKVILFFLFTSFSVSAQDKFSPTLTGSVINEALNLVSGSSVYVLKTADSSLVKIEMSDKNGAFTFSNLKSGRYLLKISSLGYQMLMYGPFDIQSYQTLNVGKLMVTAAPINLKEVSILVKENFIESKPGKLVLNVGSSILSAGSTAYDILKTSPGVQIDAEDRIRLNGKQQVLIVVNGKQTFMEHEALVDILKSMQSNEIEQIELISNPSAKFDAAGSGAIINIKTKKNKSIGTNGSANAMAGISDAGKGYDSNFRFNTGFNLNYRNKFLNVFGNYTYADIDQTRNILLNRNINNTSINVDYQGLSSRISNTYRLELDYSLQANHVFGVMVNGSDHLVDISKGNRSSILNKNVLDSTIRTESNQSRDLNNMTFNVNYKGNLGKKAGNISLDWDYITYNRNSQELLVNDFLDDDNNPYRESLLLKNSSPSTYDVQSVKFDYSVSISKKAKLDAGLQGSQVKGDSHLDFGRIVSTNFIPDPKFTNHFLIDEQIGAGYINYAVEFAKSTLALGLRAERTITEGISATSGQINNRNYLNFFPNLQYTREVNKNNNLLLSYSRRVTRPGYDNLNPFVAYLDQYSYRSGNPLLKPEFVHLGEISHVFKEKFTTTLRAKMVDDLILELNEQNDVTRVNTVISRNINRQYLYGIELNAPVELKNWWKLDLNLQASYEKYIANSIAGEFTNSSPSLIFNALQSFKFNNDLSAEINGKYESPAVYGIYDFKSAYTVDAAFAKSLFNKSAALRLRVTDLFNTSFNRYTSDYQNLNLKYRDRRDSRAAQLSFSYLFGRSTVKGARKRTTGSETEQGRIGN
ncbi:MAG TPA: outer membrane beta-barrel family protein [Sphingobacteriaceae bacterium]|nr:outer membrane beta-barrel family protein [Sphingobacteriaceae bacterium]